MKPEVSKSASVVRQEWREFVQMRYDATDKQVHTEWNAEAILALGDVLAEVGAAYNELVAAARGPRAWSGG